MHAATLAREAYGRLLAILVAQTRDISAAEDALADALLAALTQWPQQGAPRNPEAWLLTVARRRLLDARRRLAVREQAAHDVAALIERLASDDATDDATGDATDAPLPDARLRLLFVCTHPAIDPAAQVPLMLQTVLGLEAAHIASAMRVAPKTMGQRLWRAKTRIRDLHIPFEIPERPQLPSRLSAVLEAIYTAFGVAWEDVNNADVPLRELTGEAIFLARLLVSLMPEEPEALGLLALMLFSDARRAARRDDAGGYVPLEQQDQSRWDAAQIEEAEAALRAAFALGVIGPYQLEAALQSAHISGARRGALDAEAILVLYEGLMQLAPSLGASVGRAAALIRARGGREAIAALDALDGALARDYQPHWAVRAAALEACGELAAAEATYMRASGMTEDEGVRRFLSERARSLRGHVERGDPGAT